ncbi:MAG: tRNA guanosine(15) transglycosylase TgtA [Desulfurococcales archaeon]|nr:tRNA guanosine(15) transglycosylase TgtA [Desulfurococcales archaeon]
MEGPVGAFEIIDVDLAGRIAKLHLRNAKLETPAFFPVIDPMRQELGLDLIAEAGFEQVITNAYLAYKRYGPQPRGSIRELLGWRGIVMTDSGAYQILEYGDIGVTQDEILLYQKEILKPDIGVILDVPTGDVSRLEAEKTVNETIRRSQEALRVIDPTSDDVLWVLPIQGGRYLDLVEASARHAANSPYRMYGIGSPTVFLERYRYDTIIDMILAAKRALPPGRPVHLFGAGHPLIIPFAVALGVDTFDSASYIIYARDGRYITEYGVYRVEDLDYLPCECPVCSRYSPRELAEMPREDRTRLLALHNLHVISKTLKRVKQAIREGRLWELLEETARRHPAAYRALLKMRRAHSILETHTPRVKPRVRGLRLYGFESLWNPRLTRLRSRVLTHYLPERLKRLRPKRLILRPLPPSIEACKRGSSEDGYVVYYSPYLGLIPKELCGVYPTIHADYPHNYYQDRVLKVLVSEIRAVLAIARRIGVEAEILGEPDSLCWILSRTVGGARCGGG